MTAAKPMDHERLASLRSAVACGRRPQVWAADLLADRDYHAQRLEEIAESQQAWIARTQEVEAEAVALRREVARLRARVRVEAEDVVRAGVTWKHVEAWARSQHWVEAIGGGAWKPRPASWTWARLDDIPDALRVIAGYTSRPGLDILDEMAAVGA